MTQKTVEALTLSTPLVNALLNYLASRPFAEVEGLINGIREQVAPQLREPVPVETAHPETLIKEE